MKIPFRMNDYHFSTDTKYPLFIYFIFSKKDLKQPWDPITETSTNVFQNTNF